MNIAINQTITNKYVNEKVVGKVETQNSLELDKEGDLREGLIIMEVVNTMTIEQEVEVEGLKS